jgi:hypothetical protein
MAVSRHGLEVTVNNQSAQQFTLTEQTNAHTFTFNFEDMGPITLVGSATDGQEQATKVDQIDIATLKVINIGVGSVWVAKACMFDTGSDVYSVVGDQSIVGLSTSDYKPNLYYYDAMDTTMTFQEPAGQLYRQTQSVEFEQNLGFTTHFEVHGQFRDIKVDYVSVKTEAGFEEATFWSPSNGACWLKVAYNTTISDA